MVVDCRLMIGNEDAILWIACPDGVSSTIEGQEIGAIFFFNIFSQLIICGPVETGWKNA